MCIRDRLKELNAGMAELKETDPLLIGRLHDEYFNRAASRLIYEENEKSYLAQNKTLRAVVLNGKLPIQNVAAKTGEAEGIAVDFLNYISEETGLTIEYIGIDVYKRQVFGTLIGAVTGYYGGWLDDVVMRLNDMLLSFPSILLALIVISLMGPGLSLIHI